MKEALRDIRNYLIREDHYEKSAYQILAVHDETNIEIKEGYEEEISTNVESIMEAAGNKYVSHVNMAVDVTITDKWQK